MKINAILNTNFNRIQKTQSVTLPFFARTTAIQGVDTFTFSGRDPKLLSEEEGEIYADKFKSSTSGYRGNYLDTSKPQDFNDRFVYTMTHATADYIDENDRNNLTVVGGDTRQATKKYAPEIVDILNKRGINTYVPTLEELPGEIAPAPSPVLALFTKEMGIPLSLLLTASHNPWEDGGYNFLIKEGMVAESEQTNEIAKNMVNVTKKGEVKEDRCPYYQGDKQPVNLYEIYKGYMDDTGLIDFENIASVDMDIYYEDFAGTGGYYLPRLFEDHGIELKGVLSSDVKGPNPTKGNLENLSQRVVESNNPLRIGIATDGDSDRFGCVDENGNYISANDVIMLVSYHLIKNKGMTTGTIIKNHSTSEKIDALAKYFNSQEGYDIDVKSTPVGFKYLGAQMMKLEGTPKEAIVIGEESGGLTVRGHIPEKDGFVAVSNLLDLIATEKRPIGEILAEVNSLLDGEYVSDCTNIAFDSSETKEEVVASFAKYTTGEEDYIGEWKIDKEKTLAHDKQIKEQKANGDGYKIFLENGSSVLIRKSGTEPLMRYYIDAVSPEIYNDMRNYFVDIAVENGGRIK